MESKRRLALIMIGIGIIGFLGGWIYILFYFLGGKNDIISKPTTAVTGPEVKKQNSKVDNGKKVVNTGNINQAINTGNYKKTELNENIQNNIVTGGTLYVVLPRYFFNNGFKVLKNVLKRKENINVKYIFYDTKAQLEKYLLMNKFDIFLLPSDVLKDFKDYFYKFNIKNKDNLVGKFNVIFQDILLDEQYSFFPYGIDPFVSFVNKDLDFYDKISIFDIRRFFIRNRTKYRPGIVLFGIDTYIVNRHLKTDRQLFEDYDYILYNFLYSAVILNDVKILNTIIDWSKNKKFLLWSYPLFIKYKSIYSKKNSKCEIFPKLCLASFGKGKIFFGKLSDLDKLYTYFKNSKYSYKDFNVYNLPYYDTNNYPIILWGFVFMKASNKKLLASKFFTHYITLGEKNKIFWKNILSAFDKIYESQRFLNKYVKIINYEYDFTPIYSNKLKKLIKTTSILDALDGKYSLKALIENSTFIRKVIEN